MNRIDITITTNGGLYILYRHTKVFKNLIRYLLLIDY